MPSIEESPCPGCGTPPGCLSVDVPSRTLTCEACGLHLVGVLEADGRYLTFPFFDFAGTHDTTRED